MYGVDARRELAGFTPLAEFIVFDVLHQSLDELVGFKWLDVATVPKVTRIVSQDTAWP